MDGQGGHVLSGRGFTIYRPPTKNQKSEFENPEHTHANFTATLDGVKLLPGKTLPPLVTKSDNCEHDIAAPVGKVFAYLEIIF
jgi:hypothetical protein